MTTGLRWARYYDAVYSWRDYAAEVAYLQPLLKGAVLDVACGTGTHIALLAQHHEFTGVDIDLEMLAIARSKNPGVRFVQGDMATFNLERTFDTVTCLFSSIGYMSDEGRLKSAIANFARHCASGGSVLIEPWILRERFQPAALPEAHVGEGEDFRVTRMGWAVAKNGRTLIVFHYLVGTREGIEHFEEEHELGLYSDVQYRAAFKAAGLKVECDERGPMGRGLYIGRKP
jgi:SAM-dependent methyltransferase